MTYTFSLHLSKVRSIGMLVIVSMQELFMLIFHVRLSCLQLHT